MSSIDHDTYQFTLPAGWSIQPSHTDDVTAYMLFTGEADRDAAPESLDAVGSISDFTYFVREGQRPIDMYDLVETFETWAHQRKLKFDEPKETSSPRETIEFEVIGQASGADGRRHFVWLLGDKRTAVRVHFVLKELNAGTKQIMAALTGMVSSIRIQAR
ncbi:MAG: hypothetical protein KA795_15105 [Burkholderiaceae bacterium]|nr:hypothetical protein [Burkholderiaceae bacterium]